MQNSLEDWAYQRRCSVGATWSSERTGLTNIITERNYTSRYIQNVTQVSRGKEEIVGKGKLALFRELYY
jgi:hypothetical protein